MRKVLIAGGNGVIGRILAKGLMSEYEVTVLDKDRYEGLAPAIQADASNYDDLLKKIPRDTDVIVNLLAVKIKYDVMDTAEFEKMTDIFIEQATICAARQQSSASQRLFSPAAIM